jgi:homoserine O-acetyltransferase
MANIADSSISRYAIEAFKFQDGTQSNVEVAYLDINPSASKTALVISCFRGRLLSTFTFSKGALKDHRIIVVALFGNGESSSPSNAKELLGSPDYRDCVRAQHQLLTEHLGIHSLDVISGFSMGGQCTYHWTLMYPTFTRNAVIICSSARTSRHNIQFLEGPKAALQNAIDYVDTRRKDTAPPSRALRAFGKAYSAWLTSAEWFDEEMYKALGYETLEAWDRDVAGNNYAGWHEDDLLYKLHMWQKGDVTAIDPADNGDLSKSLAKIQANVLLMPCETDQYFRPDASERESRMIPRAKPEVIPSIWGHIAGAGTNDTDTKLMDKKIADFLASSP